MAFTEYSYEVTAEDMDVGDVITFTLDTKPEGMSIDEDIGLILWIPTIDQEGANEVIVVASDGDVGIKQYFNVTVSIPDNIPPTTHLVSPDDGTRVYNIFPTFEWTAEDSEEDPLTFDIYINEYQTMVDLRDPAALAGSGLTNTSFIPSTGLKRGTLYYWIVIPNDGISSGVCDNGPWSFEVSKTAIENHAPVITSEPVTEITEGSEYQYTVKATDEDGDVLTYSLEKKPTGMVIDAQSGLIVWTPKAGQIGNHDIVITVSDNTISVQQDFTIKVKALPVNKAPTITSIPDGKVKVGETFSYQVVASDPDPNDVLTYQLNNPPTGMSISSTGMIEWTPSKDQSGEHNIEVEVTDGKDPVKVQFKVTVKKEEKVEPGGSLLDPLYLIIIAIVIVVVIVVVALLMSRKGKGEVTTEQPEIEEQRPKEVEATPVTSEPIKMAIPVETPIKPEENPHLEEPTPPEPE
jgi:hypothetical protein